MKTECEIAVNTKRIFVIFLLSPKNVMSSEWVINLHCV